MSQYTNTNSKRLLSVASHSSMHSSFSESSWDSQTVATPASEHDMFSESCMGDAAAYANSFAILPSNNQEFMALAMTPQHSQMPYSPNSSFSPIDMHSFDCAPVYSTHMEQSYITQHGLPSPPLDMCYSMPLQQQPYVSPTELSFGSQYMSSSPVRPQASLNLQMTYSSPLSHHSNISFEDFDNAFANNIYQRSSMTPASSVASTPSRSSRMVKSETVESSNALQQIQDLQMVAARKKLKKERRNNSKRVKCEMTVDVSRVEKSSYECGFEGCKATFGKSEHWKRHEETVHDGERFLCKYCDQGNKCKTFQKKRLDNYKTHLELHLQHTPRTVYNLDAINDIARLILNRKVKKGAKKSTSTDPADFVNEVMNGIKQDLDETTIAACRVRLENSKHTLIKIESDSESS